MDERSEHRAGGDAAGGVPDEESTPGTPRWVKVAGVITLVVVLLVVVLIVTGRGGGHGPGRHSGGTSGGHTRPPPGVTHP